MKRASTSSHQFLYGSALRSWLGKYYQAVRAGKRLCGRHLVFALALSPAFAVSGPADLATVIAKPVSMMVDLPGEILPFLSVALHAKVQGYVERIAVDRGSIVKQGELLVELSAPEMKARIAEADSNLQTAQADRIQAQAQLAAAEATSERLKKASETPGAVAANELIQAEKQVDAAQGLVRSREGAIQAADSVVRAEKELEAYLTINAPFDGVVTDRLVHPGALVGPGSDTALVVLQQVSHLRLVVPVPEEEVGEMVPGATVSFRVPAHPDRTYSGKVARIAHALDAKTRTMPVELDVFNRDGSLAPGMFPSVKWPVQTSRPRLFVPASSVVTTSERTFVIRDQNGRAEWVDVKKGVAEGDLVEVLGNLRAGDKVVRRGTDEIHAGSKLD